jgi:hypothetical protein
MDRRSSRIPFWVAVSRASGAFSAEPRSILVQVLAKLADHRCVVLSGRTRLGAGVKARGRLDRPVAEDLSDDLILARPLIQEDLRTGVTEKMRVDVEARESKDRGLDLRA